jgi:hypothetical protein
MRTIAAPAFALVLVCLGGCSLFETKSPDPPLTGGWICCEHSNGCTSGPIADLPRAIDACTRTGGKAFPAPPQLECNKEDKCV